MPAIIIVGMGPGPLHYLTKDAEAALRSAPRVFLRTWGAHPVAEWLRDLGIPLSTFDQLYELAWRDGDDLYAFIADALVREAQLRGSAVYALPGSPSIFEQTTALLHQRAAAAGVDVRIVQGLSFLEPALAALGVDAAAGLQILLPRTHLASGRFRTDLPMLVCQIDARTAPDDPGDVARTRDWLLAAYPETHPVTLVWTDGRTETHTTPCVLKDLAAQYGAAHYYASLFVPPVARVD